MDNVFENTKCIICSEQNGTPFLTVQDRLDSSSNSYNLIQCNCGFVYLNPRPSIDGIGEYYNLIIMIHIMSNQKICGIKLIT